MDEVKIGCFGLRGHQIYGVIPKLDRARLTAVSGMDEKVYEETKETYPQFFTEATYYPDLETMLEKSDVDLVSFCSARRADQAAQAVQALKAGKHVLAEKPMATTLEDLEALRAAAADSDRHLWTMTSMVYDPRINGLKAVIDAGTIGTIVQIYGLKSYPMGTSRPQDRSVDGGLIMQAGIHAVSFIRHTTGLEFTEVFAQDTGLGNPKEGNLQTGANLAFRMNSGALAAILCNYCNQKSIGYHGNDQLRVHGTDGMIELVDGWNRRMLVVKGEKPTTFEDVAPEKDYPQDMIDSILDGTPTLLSEEDGFRNTRAVLRAQESATKGVPLKI